MRGSSQSRAETSSQFSRPARGTRYQHSAAPGVAGGDCMRTIVRALLSDPEARHTGPGPDYHRAAHAAAGPASAGAAWDARAIKSPSRSAPDRRRNTIERCFSTLKQHRAVAGRINERPSVYEGAAGLRQPVSRVLSGLQLSSPRSSSGAPIHRHGGHSQSSRGHPFHLNAVVVVDGAASHVGIALINRGVDA
jgi:hypothetical protein